MIQMLGISVFIDGEQDLGQSEFVEGRIAGIIDCICGKHRNKHFTIRDYGFGKILTAEGTPEEYLNLKNTIDRIYPKLCRFGTKNIG